MKEEINHQRQEYENILEVKLALDTEIAVYKSLIDAEEEKNFKVTFCSNYLGMNRAWWFTKLPASSLNYLGFLEKMCI